MSLPLWSRLSLRDHQKQVNCQRLDMTPFFKNGDKCDPANYRPIFCIKSLLPQMNKLDILYGLHGFREKSSWETQNVTVLDFSKAFDKVNHLHGIKGKTRDQSGSNPGCSA